MESVRLVLASPNIWLEHGLGGRVCPPEEDALQWAVPAAPCGRLDGRFLNAALGDGHRVVRRQAPKCDAATANRTDVRCVLEGEGEGCGIYVRVVLSLKNEYYKYLIAYSWIKPPVETHKK